MRNVTKALALLAAFAGPPALAKTYEIDPVHSEVIFRIGHLQISGVYGRFNDLTGSFELNDAGDLVAASAQVGAKSIDTNVQDRDDDVRENYIHAAEYPQITFKAEKIEKLGKDSYKLTGPLTMHGKTRTLEAVAKKMGQGFAMGYERVGAETSFTVKRSDFNMSYGVPNVGDEVLLLLNIEGELEK